MSLSHLAIHCAFIVGLTPSWPEWRAVLESPPAPQHSLRRDTGGSVCPSVRPPPYNSANSLCRHLPTRLQVQVPQLTLPHFPFQLQCLCFKGPSQFMPFLSFYIPKAPLKFTFPRLQLCFTIRDTQVGQLQVCDFVSAFLDHWCWQFWNVTAELCETDPASWRAWLDDDPSTELLAELIKSRLLLTRPAAIVANACFFFSPTPSFIDFQK